MAITFTNLFDSIDEFQASQFGKLGKKCPNRSINESEKDQIRKTCIRNYLRSENAYTEIWCRSLFYGTIALSSKQRQSKQPSNIYKVHEMPQLFLIRALNCDQTPAETYANECYF